MTMISYSHQGKLNGKMNQIDISIAPIIFPAIMEQPFTLFQLSFIRFIWTILLGATKHVWILDIFLDWLQCGLIEWNSCQSLIIKVDNGVVIISWDDCDLFLTHG